MLRLHQAARTAVLGLCTAVAAAASVAADPVYQALRQAPITDAFVAKNIVLHRDAGTLTLKSGTIGFTAPAMGRDTVVVFAGEGEFDLTPVPAIEKSYLKSLTDQDAVHESFDRALLAFTDGNRQGDSRAGEDQGRKRQTPGRAARIPQAPPRKLE